MKKRIPSVWRTDDEWVYMIYEYCETSKRETSTGRHRTRWFHLKGSSEAWTSKILQTLGITFKDRTVSKTGKESKRDSSDAHDHPVTQLPLAIICILFIEAFVPSPPLDPCFFIRDLPLQPHADRNLNDIFIFL